jgi:hypothetical protein
MKPVAVPLCIGDGVREGWGDACEDTSEDVSGDVSGDITGEGSCWRRFRYNKPTITKRAIAATSDVTAIPMIAEVGHPV